MNWLKFPMLTQLDSQPAVNHVLLQTAVLPLCVLLSYTDETAWHIVLKLALFYCIWNCYAYSNCKENCKEKLSKAPFLHRATIFRFTEILPLTVLNLHHLDFFLKQPSQGDALAFRKSVRKYAVSSGSWFYFEKEGTVCWSYCQ